MLDMLAMFKMGDCNGIRVRVEASDAHCFIIDNKKFLFCSGTQASEMLDMLAMFKMGDCNGIRVRVDRLQTLIASSFVEHLDFQVPDGW